MNIGEFYQEDSEILKSRSSINQRTRIGLCLSNDKFIYIGLYEYRNLSDPKKSKEMRLFDEWDNMIVSVKQYKMTLLERKEKIELFKLFKKSRQAHYVLLRKVFDETKKPKKYY